MAGMDETAVRKIALGLTDSERELLRTALRLLIATLGRDEADELREAQALLARLEVARSA
jgi:hypothetical protein